MPYLLWYNTASPGATIWATMGLVVPSLTQPGLLGLRVEMPKGFEHRVVVSTRDHTKGGASVVWIPFHFQDLRPGIFGDYDDWSLLYRSMETQTAYSQGDNTGSGESHELP